MKLFLFISVILSQVAFGLDFSEEILRERLTSMVRDEMPNNAQIEIANLYFKGRAPVTASLTLTSPEPALGLVSFRLTWIDNNELRHADGKATIKAHVYIAVAKNPIRNQVLFGAGNVKFVRREISRYANTGYYTSWAKLRKMRSRGYIRPGVVLGGSNTQTDFLVFRDQMVDLVDSRGRLRVSAKVRALQDGKHGKWIRVRNPKTKKILQARVQSDGTVTTR